MYLFLDFPRVQIFAKNRFKCFVVGVSVLKFMFPGWSSYIGCIYLITIRNRLRKILYGILENRLMNFVVFQLCFPLKNTMHNGVFQVFLGYFFIWNQLVKTFLSLLLTIRKLMMPYKMKSYLMAHVLLIPYPYQIYWVKYLYLKKYFFFLFHIGQFSRRINCSTPASSFRRYEHNFGFKSDPTSNFILGLLCI